MSFSDACHLGDSQMRQQEENQSNTNTSSYGKRIGTEDRQSNLTRHYFTICVTLGKLINLSEFQFALLLKEKKKW